MWIRNILQSSWLKSAILIPVLISAFTLFGIIGSSGWFDLTPWVHLKQLGAKDLGLAYLAVLFAIQIPVLILLLQWIAGAGLIRDKILPGVVHFRETLTSYILLSLLLLLAPRASYYYFPLIALTFISALTIYESIQIMFDTLGTSNKERPYVERLIKSAFTNNLSNRVSSNNFFTLIDKTKKVTHEFRFFRTNEDDYTTYPIESPKGGFVKTIDIKLLNSLILSEYSGSLPTEDITDTTKEIESEHKTPPLIVLRVRPETTVEAHATLMKLVLPKELEPPSKKFVKKLQDAVRITGEPAGASNILDALIGDFKQQLRKAITDENVILANQALGFYSQLLEGVASFSKAGDDAGYTVRDARQEFREVFADSLSKRLQYISEIITDEISYSIRKDKVDTSRELISFVYRDLLDVTSKFDALSAARADQTFAAVFVGQIFNEDEDSTLRRQVFESLASKYKEHTGLLLSYYKSKSEQPITDEEIVEWLTSRLNDIRSYLLATYKKGKIDQFKQLLSIYKEFERQYRVSDDEGKELTLLERCGAFAVAAYINHRKDLQGYDDAWKALEEFLAPLRATEITEILIECIEKRYSDTWRLDTYDLPADGEFREVPDFDKNIKELWVKLMITKSLPGDPSAFDGIPLDKSLAFTDGKSKLNDSYIYQLVEKETGASATKLKELVSNFFDRRIAFEQSQLAETPVDESKVNKFRDEVVEAYTERSFIMKLLDFGKVQFSSRPNRYFKGLGWNQIKDKPAFATIEGWHTGYYIDGDQYGSEIARAQNETIAKALLSSPNVHPSVRDMLNKIKQDSGQWVFIANNVHSFTFDHFYQDIFKEGKAYGDIWIKGVNQPISVVHIYNDELAAGFYAVKLDSIPALKVSNLTDKAIDVTVSAYSHNEKERAEILAKPPKWLTDKGPNDDQVRFLNTMVRVQVGQTYFYPRHPKVIAHFAEVPESN
jgi:hypothetical protein